MPASMMSAPVGSTLKVSGISIAIVAIGPTPGSTPISVPTRTPTKQSRRFAGDNAVAKPSPRLPMRSNMVFSVADEPRCQWDREPEREFEQADAERGHQGAEQDRLAPTHFIARNRGDHDGEWSGNDQPERPHG